MSEEAPWEFADAVPLHPLLMADVLARKSRPPLSSMKPAEARERFRQINIGAAPVPQELTVSDSVIPARGGPLGIRVRLVA
jgi:hypothetical protein